MNADQKKNIPGVIGVHRRSPAARLLEWYAKGHRALPWRATSDPYAIWISEIMLQQTRAQAAIPYYERFLQRFPTVKVLASAEEEEVLTAWAGLGYYSRARNVLRAAREIAAAGAFPRDYAAIRALPGIGDYTAAAVASIAFGLPHAVLDGNVMRVVARVCNDAADIGAMRTRERFREIAQQWLEETPDRAAAFNQALMELGATVCLPKAPLCLVCPLADVCEARAAGRENELPVKLRKQEPVEIAEVVLVVRRGEEVLLRRRAADARHMAGFWDLPLRRELRAREGERLGDFRHTITHHHFTFTVMGASARPRGSEFGWFHPDRFSAIPLATTAKKGLRAAGIL
ncbi:MAG TPA: A/G-specific adenine glycosylase [Candidatus Limnocylindrales bacterium]|nr:A/G-specific adenine glycosylase [Candidatus Limnocylindrales bacterium]